MQTFADSFQFANTTNLKPCENQSVYRMLINRQPTSNTVQYKRGSKISCVMNCMCLLETKMADPHDRTKRNDQEPTPICQDVSVRKLDYCLYSKYTMYCLYGNTYYCLHGNVCNCVYNNIYVLLSPWQQYTTVSIVIYIYIYVYNCFHGNNIQLCL